MFKCTGGDFPKTMAHNKGIITWGIGPDKTMDLHGKVSALEIVSENEKSIEFKCTLSDGRWFSAVADPKNYGPLKALSEDTGSENVSTVDTKTYGSRKCTYCGGLPDLTKQCEVTVKVTTREVHISAGMLKKYTIPVSAITDCSFKTEEQISKDVTLTRLFLFGVFALGMKKKTKEVHSFLVVTYEDRGVSVSAILTGPETAKLNSDIIKARQDSFSAAN